MGDLLVVGTAPAPGDGPVGNRPRGDKGKARANCPDSGRLPVRSMSYGRLDDRLSTVDQVDGLSIEYSRGLQLGSLAMRCRGSGLVAKEFTPWSFPGLEMG